MFSVPIVHQLHGPTHAMFGQLMLPLQVGGKVRVGDEVTQMDRKKKHENVHTKCC